MLTERTVIGSLDIKEDGTIGMRTDTIIERNDVEISRMYHRQVLTPLDDVSAQSEKVRAVSAAVWTPEVVRTYRERRDALEAAGNARRNPV